MTHPRTKKRVGLLGLGAQTSLRGIRQGDGAGKEASEALFSHSVGVALDVDDGGTVKESIEGGGGHDGVAGEDVAPVGEGFIGGNDRGGLFFVAATDNLDEQRGEYAANVDVALVARFRS